MVFASAGQASPACSSDQRARTPALQRRLELGATSVPATDRNNPPRPVDGLNFASPQARHAACGGALGLLLR